MKRCPCCSGCYPDDLVYCPSCGGGNKVELATREEYASHTGKGFETIKSKHIKERRFAEIRNDFDKMNSARKFKEEQELKEVQLREEQNLPKCPTCSSTNIEKISSFDKAAGAVMFGLFSKTARSQFKCKNCGYKW